MKGFSFIAVFMAVLVVLSISSASVAADIPVLTVTLTKQTPYPVEPGKILNIEVSLHNNGTSTSAMVLEIVPEAPFTLLPGQDLKKTFSRIASFDSVSNTYRLKVDESAISDEYSLEFRYYREGSTTFFVKQVPISVQGTPKIAIESIVTDPEEIEPGNEVEISVDLLNVGTGNAYQTALSLVSEADETTGESAIVPILSGGVYYMGDFLSDEKKTAVFNVQIENDAETKTYLSTLSVAYNDENGAAQSTTFSVGLPIKGKPVIEVLSAKPDNGAFKVDIENIGTASAKALKISLVQDNDIKDSAVANELKPTKHKTIRFQGFRYGNAIINISYLDESNKYFVNEIPVSIKQSIIPEESSNQGLSPYAPLLILIIIVESYYVWRLRKRMKK